MDHAFSGFFEALSEGAYIGLFHAAGTTTLAANPHLRLMFGWPAHTPATGVLPFDADRFADDQARDDFLKALSQDGHVESYLLRLRRAPGPVFWVEVTARAEPVADGGGLRVEAVLRDVTERKKLQDQAKQIYGDKMMITPDLWKQFMQMQAPAMQGMLGNYLEQSAKLFMDMQQRMQDGGQPGPGGRQRQGGQGGRRGPAPEPAPEQE